MSDHTSDPGKSFRDLIRHAASNLPKPVRLRAENAYDGFDRARRLLEMDREMASFRAITAEEEAATALFISLKLREYPGSDLLNLRAHRHKAALGPFIQAVQHSLASGGAIKLHLNLDASKPALEVALPLAQFGVDHPGDLQIVLHHPLGVISAHEGVEPKDFFDRSLKKVAGSQAVDRLIDREANARNLLLYSSDSNLPRSHATLSTIDIRQKRAEVALMLSIAVLQVEEHQGMATQCLAAFLKVIGRAKKEPPTANDGD